tara:strand:- start:18 stop:560 length:543 start_codon:yes stop_codon:yes gene_type:complete
MQIQSHRKYYQKAENRRFINKFNINTGMIITFRYVGSKDPKPLVFIMDTDEFTTADKKSVSGINLNYLPIGEVNRLFIRILGNVAWELDIQTRFPKVNFWDEEEPGIKPNIIYDKIIKPELLPRRDCWRTYKYNKIASVEQIIFEFDAKPLNQLSEIAKTKKLETISKSDMYKYLKEYNK